MKRFCNKCEEILGYKVIDEILVKYCSNCNEIEKNINPKTIVTKNFSKNKVNIDKVRSVVYDDYLYPEIKKKIPEHKCGDTISYYLDMDSMKRVYVCKKCRNYWI